MNMLAHHSKEERPWGSFEDFTLNERTTVKILRLKPEGRLSLQKHAHRSEYWRVLEGSGIAQIDDEMRAVRSGDDIELPLGSLHRLTAGPDGIAVLEISFGDFDENDIERIEDDYGRAS